MRSIFVGTMDCRTTTAPLWAKYEYKANWRIPGNLIIYLVTHRKIQQTTCFQHHRGNHIFMCSKQCFLCCIPMIYYSKYPSIPVYLRFSCFYCPWLITDLLTVCISFIYWQIKPRRHTTFYLWNPFEMTIISNGNKLSLSLSTFLVVETVHDSILLIC